jgi:hypothetical protein
LYQSFVAEIEGKKELGRGWICNGTIAFGSTNISWRGTET